MIRIRPRSPAFGVSCGVGCKVAVLYLSGFVCFIVTALRGVVEFCNFFFFFYLKWCIGAFVKVQVPGREEHSFDGHEFLLFLIMSDALVEFVICWFLLVMFSY
jgi:hypothetical protein